MNPKSLPKRDIALALLTKQPRLTDRAIAKLAGISNHTVASARSEIILPIARREVSGRKARGRKPAPRIIMKEYAVYRCYDGKKRLLYIGCTEQPQQHFRNHRSETPWWSNVEEIVLTHYPTIKDAQSAEAKAIRKEKPRYNLTPPKKPLQKQPIKSLMATETRRKAAVQRHAEMVQQAEARSDKPAFRRPRS